MKNVNEYVTVTNDGRCIMTQLKSLSMKFLPIFCENCISIFKIFSSTTIYRLFIDLHGLTIHCISTSIGEASYFWNRNSDRIWMNSNELQVQYQEFCIPRNQIGILGTFICLINIYHPIKYCAFLWKF